MAKKLIDSKPKLKGLPIMNGQGADALFCNYRFYFKEHISEKLHHPVRCFSYYNKINEKNPFFKLLSYFIDTKSRFFRYYLSDYPFDSYILSELEKVYSIYEKNIRNDSANLLAASLLMLRNSIHGIEKIKASARASSQKYYLPFMATNIIKFAFSIPSKYKVGYKLGKKILVKSYPEIRSIPFKSKSFL